MGLIFALLVNFQYFLQLLPVVTICKVTRGRELAKISEQLG